MKSAFLSKINWTQFIAFLAMILTVFGVELPAEIQAELVVIIGSIQAVVTWILRTWFTTKLTKSSVE